MSHAIMERTSRRRLHVRVVVLLSVVIATGTCLIAIVRHVSRQRTREKQTKLIACAMMLEAYDEVNGHLPSLAVTDATGNLLYSWRVSTLPFSPDSAIKVDYTASWNSPENSEAAHSSPWWLCFNARASGTARFETNVLAVGGEGAAFEVGTNYRMRDLPDDLILLIATQSTGIHWMEPRDLDVSCLAEQLQQKNAGDFISVVFRDQSVWQLKASAMREAILPFCTIQGARQSNREKELGPYLISRLRGE